MKSKIAVRGRSRSLVRYLALAALLIGCAVLLSGCSLLSEATPQTTFQPRSEVSNQIQDLFWATVWWGLAIVVPVEIVLFYTIFRFRRRPGVDPGPPTGRHGSTRLEIAWTIVPVVVLAAIAVPTVKTIFATAAPAPGHPVQVHVTAHQWWWEISYPQYHIVTANELHLPVNRTANFALDSADVIHSFWIPAFDGKRDVFPNHTNNLWFTPNVTGVFPGQCAEFCGPSHTYMQMTTVVQSPSAFAAWVRRQQQAQHLPATASAEVRRGGMLFANVGCAGCHTIAGTTAAGKIGPNLTHVGSRMNIGIQQILTNTHANLMSWVHDAPSFKPGSHMPAQNLNNADLTAIVDYLQSLK